MRTGRPKAELVLSDAERLQLQSFARSRSLPAALSSRALTASQPILKAGAVHRSLESTRLVDTIVATYAANLKGGMAGRLRILNHSAKSTGYHRARGT